MPIRTRIGSLSGAVIDLRGLRDRQRDAGRLEPEARRQIDDRLPSRRRPALSSDVDAIRNQVVVGVGERAIVGVERREIEVLLRAAARAGSALAAVRTRSGGRARSADRRSRSAIRARTRTAAPAPLAYDSARFASRAPVAVELIQRDHRLHEVAAVVHLQRRR